MKKLLPFLFLTFSIQFAFAANPSVPFSPQDRVLDPNCLPADSNCYIQEYNQIFLNATTSNLTATGTTVLATTTISNLNVTNSITANSFAVTNASTSNATSSNFFSTILNSISAFFTNLVADNATTSRLVTGNLTATSTSVLASTTINGTLNVSSGHTTLFTASSSGFTSNNLYATTSNLKTVNSSIAINASGTLAVSGNSSLATTTITDLTVSGSSTLGGALSVNGDISPYTDVTFSLGSLLRRWDNIFVRNIFASSSIIVDASSTNFFTTNLNAIYGTIDTLAVGTSTVSGNLSVGGQTSLNNASTSNISTTNLYATGTSALASTTVSGILGVTGDTIISSSLSVTGQTNLTNASTSNVSTGNLYATGTVTLATTTMSNLNVSGSSTLATTTMSNLNVSGSSTLSNLLVNGSSTFQYIAPDLDITFSIGDVLKRFKNIFVENIFASSSVITTASSTNLFTTNLTSNGANITGDTTVGGTLGVTGTTTLSSSLSVGGQTNLANASTSNLSTGNLYATGTLFIGSVNSEATSTRLALVGGMFDLRATSTEGTLGAELITNVPDRDFSSSGNWSGSNWSVGAGVATHVAGNDSFTLSTPLPTAGNYYQIQFDIETTSTGTPGVSVSFGGVNATPVYGVNQDGAQTNQIVVVQAFNTNPLTFTPNNTTWTGTIDNVSVKQITVSSIAQIIRNADGTSGIEFRAGGASQNNTLIGKDTGLYNTTGSNNSFLGYRSGYNNTSGSNNLFLGNSSGFVNTSGSNNSFLGYRSGYSNTTGAGNAFLGNNSGYSNTTGAGNAFLGSDSGYSNTTGYSNSFIGYRSGQYNTTGNSNSFVGDGSGRFNTVGYSNSFMGYGSGYNNVTGNNNSFFGFSSGYNNLSGSSNTFLGDNSGLSNVTGSGNSFVGNNAANLNVGGDNNAFLGYGAGYNIATSTNNTIVGYQAGYGTVTSSSSDNTLLGYQSGFNMEDTVGNLYLGYLAGYNSNLGNYNVAIGYNVQLASTTGSNQMNIGGLIYGTGLSNDGFAAGPTANVGIGTSTPGSKLDIYYANSASDVDVFRIISDVGAVGTTTLRIDSDGDLYTNGGVIAGSADIAENYSSQETILPGTVVALASSSQDWSINNRGTSSLVYKVSEVRTASNGDNVFGIISTRPAMTLGNGTANGVPVALTGRVPVNVTNENGVIKKGDYIVLSETVPGFAMKQTENGKTLGRALSDAEDISTSTVLVFIENINHNVTLSGLAGSQSVEEMISSAMSTSTAVKSTVLESIQRGKSIISNLVVVKLSAVVAYIDKIFAKEIHTEILCVKKTSGQEVCFNGDELENILGPGSSQTTTSSTGSSGSVTPVVTSDTSSSTSTDIVTASSTTSTTETINSTTTQSSDTSVSEMPVMTPVVEGSTTTETTPTTVTTEGLNP